MASRNRQAGEIEETLTVEIVSAVAEREDVDPVELLPPLADVVDPGALADVLHPPAEDVRARFRYRGLDVEVGPGGEIAVRSPADER